MQQMLRIGGDRGVVLNQCPDRNKRPVMRVLQTHPEIQTAGPRVQSTDLEAVRLPRRGLLPAALLTVEAPKAPKGGHAVCHR